MGKKYRRNRQPDSAVAKTISAGGDGGAEFWIEIAFKAPHSRYFVQFPRRFAREFERPRTSGGSICKGSAIRRRNCGAHFQRFNPLGISRVAVIAESRLALHTQPEHAFAAVDLFSVSTALDWQHIARELVVALGATRSTLRQEPREDMRISLEKHRVGGESLRPTPPTHPEELKHMTCYEKIV